MSFIGDFDCRFVFFNKQACALPRGHAGEHKTQEFVSDFTAPPMIQDMGDYPEMLFIVHQKGGYIELGGGFLNVCFKTVGEAQTYCRETAKLLNPNVTLQPAKEHNGQLVGTAVKGSYRKVRP